MAHFLDGDAPGEAAELRASRKLFLSSTCSSQIYLRPVVYLTTLAEGKPSADQ